MAPRTFAEIWRNVRGNLAEPFFKLTRGSYSEADEIFKLTREGPTQEQMTVPLRRWILPFVRTVLLKTESIKFTFLRPHVSFDFVFAHLNFTPSAAHSLLPVLCPRLVHVRALALCRSLVSRKIPRGHQTVTVLTSHPVQVQIGQPPCNFVRLAHSSQ